MAATMLTQVKVDGTDISSTRLKKWNIIETFGDEIQDAEIETTNKIFNDIPTLRNGMTLTIKRGFTTSTDQFIFDGLIDTIEKKGATIIIRARDLMINLIKASVTKSYDGISFPSTEAKGSDIATDLIENQAGMSAEVVDTGSLLTLSIFKCNRTDVFGRLQVLAGIYDYQIYYNPTTAKVHFEPLGYTANSQTIHIGGSNNNVSGVPKWKIDNSQCINKLTVEGAVQEVEDDETFDGDNSSNQVFTLSKIPIVVKVYEEVGGNLVLKTPGVDSSTSPGFDYTINKENKKITATDNWTPASGSNNITTHYTNAIPIPVQVEDIESQALYGVWSAIKSFSDIQTVADAELRGNAWIDKYKEPFINTMIKPPILIDFNVGEKITVIDIINNENRSVVINEITRKYPHSGDELKVGNKEWKLAEWGKFTLERIKRIEEENQKNTDLLIQIKSFTFDVEHRHRYLKILKKSIKSSNDILIIDHPTYGLIDTYKLGGDAFDAEGVTRLVWPNQTYTEDFIDEDFKGQGTGVWNTTLKQLEL